MTWWWFKRTLVQTTIWTEEIEAPTSEEAAEADVDFDAYRDTSGCHLVYKKVGVVEVHPLRATAPARHAEGAALPPFEGAVPVIVYEKRSWIEGGDRYYVEEEGDAGQRLGMFPTEELAKRFLATFTEKKP